MKHIVRGQLITATVRLLEDAHALDDAMVKGDRQAASLAHQRIETGVGLLLVTLGVPITEAQQIRDLIRGQRASAITPEE